MSTDSPKIAALKKQYRNSFPEKLEQLNLLLSEVFKNQDSESFRGNLHEFLHRLAGSSGMYGYEAISRLCRRLMDEVYTADEDLLAKDLKLLKQLLGDDSES